MLSNVDGLALRAIAAGKRAAILDRIKQELSDEQRRRAQSAVAGYRKLENSYRLRRDMYEMTKLGSRMRQLLSLLRAGAYGARAHWGVGKKALARDVCAMCSFTTRRPHRDGAINNSSCNPGRCAARKWTIAGEGSVPRQRNRPASAGTAALTVPMSPQEQALRDG